MKSLLVTSFLLLSFKAEAFATPQRLALYDCAYMADDSLVESLSVYDSRLGNRRFYEVGVRLSSAAGVDEVFRTVNLVNEYGGRVQTFGTGNFRVKINRVYPVEGKFRAFARLPDYDMHSEQWTCKDVLEHN